MGIFNETASGGTSGAPGWLLDDTNSNAAANHAALVAFENSVNEGESGTTFSSALETFLSAVQSTAGDALSNITFNESTIQYDHSTGGAGQEDDIATINSELMNLFEAIVHAYFRYQVGTTRNDVLSGSFIEKVFDGIKTNWPNWFLSDTTDYVEYFKEKFSTKIVVAPESTNDNVIIRGGNLVAIDFQANTETVTIVGAALDGVEVSDAHVSFSSIDNSTIENGTVTRCMVRDSDLDVTTGTLVWDHNLVKEITFTSTSGLVNENSVSITQSDVMKQAL